MIFTNGLSINSAIVFSERRAEIIFPEVPMIFSFLDEIKFEISLTSPFINTSVIDVLDNFVELIFSRKAIFTDVCAKDKVVVTKSRIVNR